MTTISVIVPVFRTEAFLRTCIESILQQSYQALELILVDDGSPDGSGRICDEYANLDSRVVVIHKKNGGVSSARNAGLDIAKGEYVTFVDSDDWIHPDFLLNGIAACEEYGLDLYCSGFARVHANGAQQNSIISQPILGYTDALSQEEMVNLLEKNYIASSAVKLIRRELIEHIRFDTRMAWGEDLKFIFSLLEQHHRIYAEPRIDYFYRVGHSSTTASANLKKCHNIAQTYAELYSVITKRNFGIGVYSRFIDWRCREDLMYSEQLVLRGSVSFIKKCQMLAALMTINNQITFMQDPLLIRHIKCYSKFPFLLLLRNNLSKLKLH